MRKMLLFSFPQLILKQGWKKNYFTLTFELRMIFDEWSRKLKTKQVT